MDQKLKMIVIVFILVISEQAHPQINLPTFHAINRKSVPGHPGFSVTALSFGNNDRYNTGDDFIEIPWSIGLKDYTISDSSSFTVTILSLIHI